MSTSSIVGGSMGIERNINKWDASILEDRDTIGD